MSKKWIIQISIIILLIGIGLTIYFVSSSDEATDSGNKQIISDDKDDDSSSSQPIVIVIDDDLRTSDFCESDEDLYYDQLNDHRCQIYTCTGGGGETNCDGVSSQVCSVLLPKNVEFELSKCRYSNTDGHLLFYDSSDRLIGIGVDDGESSQSSVADFYHIYEYDDEGNRIKTEYYDSDGNPIE